MDDNTNKQKISALASGINVFMSCLGAGILSLPWNLAGSSLIVGCTIMFFGFIFTVFTTDIIIRAAEKYNTFDLGQLCKHLPIHIRIYAIYICNTLVWLTSLGCLISYEITAADAMSGIFPDVERVYWVLGSGILALSLCLVPQNLLSFTSSISIFINIYLFVLVLIDFNEAIKDLNKRNTEICLLGFDKGAITFLSGFAASSTIQCVCLPIYRDLDNKSPILFRRIMSYALSMLLVLFCMFCACAYVAYDLVRVKEDMLDLLPNELAGNIARTGMMIVVICVYPFVLEPMVTPFFQTQTSTVDVKVVTVAEQKIELPLLKFRVILTIAITAIATIIATFIEKLGVVNVINGALCLFFYMGIAPGFIGLYLVESPSFSWKCSMYIMMIAAFILSIVALIFTDNYANALIKTCLWRG